MSEQANRSSLGLDPKVGGLLCYLLGWVTGVVFILVEKDDLDIRFHAFQSLATFGSLSLLGLIAGWIPVIGGLIGMLIGPAGLILWIVLMVKAYQGERFKLPVVGDWAEQQLE